ncbi:MAG: tetratricopeptide repeat protein [Ktedonobacteraceae bacterium]|nr:tetratricopeptide repeat protein [Ktedonobacteraceae bacterium]MBV9022114.1 tetratricopeptide repeat protein [Ktedonobacteraceae bacterium]
MTQQAQSTEERARSKKQWTELAVKQAQEGLWQEAVVTNRNILNVFPQEPDAYNRLGKAYSELGQYTEARQAYSQTLKYDPKNTIAKKNLDRLAPLQDTSVQTHSSVERIDPRRFIEEPGKTGMTELINLAGPSVLAKVGVGDSVQLYVIGHTLLVRSTAGEDIGQIEPRLANRLINFMEGGNRYAAAILAMEHGQVRLIIREDYQHPSMFGKVSFPSQGGGDMIRAYIKDSILRYDREDDDELGNDDEYYDGGDEPEEVTEVEFDTSTEPEE